MVYQFCEKTLKKEVACDGIGLHSGKPIHMLMKPAPVGTGVIFVRTDVQDKDNQVPAKYDFVVDTRMNTCIGNKSGVVVGTIEHLMSALNGLGLTNVYIEVNGPETPLMDGSASDFIDLIEKVGLVDQNAPLKAFKILKEVKFEDGKGASVSLAPAEKGLRLNFMIDFPESKVIGHQEYSLSLSPEAFKKSVAFARTFGFIKDIEMLHSMGLAKGGSLKNAVVVDGDHVMNPEGIRDPNEFVIHKLLDSIGDLYQLGLPIIGAYQGVRSGHMHTNMLLRKLMADPSAYEIVTLDEYLK